MLVVTIVLGLCFQVNSQLVRQEIDPGLPIFVIETPPGFPFLNVPRIPFASEEPFSTPHVNIMDHMNGTILNPMPEPPYSFLEFLRFGPSTQFKQLPPRNSVAPPSPNPEYWIAAPAPSPNPEYRIAAPSPSPNPEYWIAAPVALPKTRTKVIRKNAPRKILVQNIKSTQTLSTNVKTVQIPIGDWKFETPNSETLATKKI